MNLGRLLIGAGIALVAAGVLVLVSERLPFKFGRLPGDIHLGDGRNWSFSFPIVTCIVLSIILSVILNLINRR